jgi:excisionase family DNA binding protein
MNESDAHMEKFLYKMPEAAKALDLGLTKTYELANSGQLRTVRIGRSIRVPADALIEYVRELQRVSDVVPLTPLPPPS